MRYSGIYEFHEEAIKLEVVSRKIDLKNNLDLEEPIEMTPCSKDLFPEAEDQFESLELNTGLCSSMNGPEIQGSSVNRIHYYISIRFKLCQNDSQCLSDEKISEFLRVAKPVAVVYIYDTIFQPKNKTNFTKKFLNNFELPITFQNMKTSNLFLAESKLQADKAYFIESNVEKYAGVVLYSFRDFTSTRTSDENILATINMMSSKECHHLSINYMQLSTLIANIGAIVGNLLLAFDFVAKSVNEIIFTKEHIENLVTLKEDKKSSNHMRSTKINQPSNFVYMTNNKMMEPSVVPQKYSLKFKDRIQSIDNPSISNSTNPSQKIKIWPCKYTISSYLNTPPFKYICCPSRNFTHYDRVSKILASKWEYLSIFSKLQEVDLMKYLLFNNDELNVLKSIKKPGIIFSSFSDNFTYSDEFAEFYLNNTNDCLKNEEMSDIIRNDERSKESIKKLYQEEQFTASIKVKKMLKLNNLS